MCLTCRTSEVIHVILTGAFPLLLATCAVACACATSDFRIRCNRVRPPLAPLGCPIPFCAAVSCCDSRNRRAETKELINAGFWEWLKPMQSSSDNQSSSLELSSLSVPSVLGVPGTIIEGEQESGGSSGDHVIAADPHHCCFVSCLSL